ncbi:MAG: ABC transporter ATP-binding protein [Ktedonobacterales bacterium]
MADVRFEHIYKRYTEQTNVISDLNLHVRDHEFLVLVGPSGCGKSTVLRMVAGLEEVSAGDLYIGARRVNDIAPKDRDIAMVFQNYALYPHMSVYDNLAFSLKLRHFAKEEIRTRVNSAARMLGIGEYLQRKPKQLSGGQRQRVALGRALVREPQVFLMDEPLSNLDAKLRVQTRADIARLHQQVPTTTIYVTHDQVEAMTLGDRIAVLNGGIIQQIGSPNEVYDAPANLFVASFIGSPSMNFFKAHLGGPLDGASSSSSRASVVIGEGAQARALPLSDALAAAVANGRAGQDGQSIIVGIRPEALSLVPEATTASLVGEVDVVEQLGNEQLVYVRMPGAMVTDTAVTRGSTARVPAQAAVRVGQPLALAVDTSRIQLFDPQSTIRLT